MNLTSILASAGAAGGQNARETNEAKEKDDAKDTTSSTQSGATSPEETPPPSDTGPVSASQDTNESSANPNTGSGRTPDASTTGGSAYNGQSAHATDSAKSPPSRAVSAEEAITEAILARSTAPSSEGDEIAAREAALAAQARQKFTMLLEAVQAPVETTPIGTAETPAAEEAKADGTPV